MKTPRSRPRFQAPSRHYHRHRVEDPDPWNTWIGGSKKPEAGKGRKLAGWITALVIFSGLIAFVCYQMR